MKYEKLYPPPSISSSLNQTSKERSVSGSREYVDYIAESHLRIWYNTQPEGYANHYHNAMEIIVCAENQYIITTKNSTYTLKPGDILIIPPYMLHELHSEPSGSRFIYLIDVDMLHCFQDYKALNPAFIEPYLCTAALRPDIYRQVYNSLMRMADLYFSHQVFWEISIYSVLLELFATIGADHYLKNSDKSVEDTSDKQSENYALFANLLNFIDTHYADDLTLEQAAEYIGFSKYHFTRLFKQHTNTTFHNYLCYKRIQAAQSLLTADRNRPITDIAFCSGFNNLTTFNRCFSKYTNCSPTEYRNKLRHEEV